MMKVVNFTHTREGFNGSEVKRIMFQTSCSQKTEEHIWVELFLCAPHVDHHVVATHDDKIYTENPSLRGSCAMTQGRHLDNIILIRRVSCSVPTPELDGKHETGLVYNWAI